MAEEKRTSSTTLVVQPTGNPDGKGANGFLADWQQSAPRGVAVKPRRQIMSEFFTSMLVLSAELRYRPTVGVPNFLYWIDGNWMLSLINPAQWTPRHQAGFAGTCVLQADKTWTLNPSEQLMTKGPLADAVGRVYDAFRESLDSDMTLEDILPFHVSHMSYWQRLYANALSRSIRATVTLGGQKKKKAKDWLPALPASEDLGESIQ